MVNSPTENSAGGSSGRPERPSAEPPPRFIIDPDDVRDGIVRLRGAEGHHARNVIRLGRGDPFVAIDGRGVEYEAVVEVRSGDGLLGKVMRTTRRSREPLARVVLAQALLRPAELGAVVSQGTELGVSEFALFECGRSQRREVPPRELEHLRGVAAAAVKQSLRAVLPKVAGPVSFGDVLAHGRDADVAFICKADPAAEPLAEVLGRRKPRPSRFVVAVGPEGGFDRAEEERALDAGFKILELGPRRLRADFAGAVACALIFHASGDLGPTGRGGG
ncbi:MAG TPA: RsmE family RNA methyltransferase [bacterium]|nr:RsmE family RNA methyltransferase [bacterium]